MSSEFGKLKLKALSPQISKSNYVRGESNIDHATYNVHWTFWGWGGQPMDVIFPISVAPIDELET